MNIISASNPQWADAAQTRINLDIETGKYGVIPFTASPNDSEKHGRDLFAQAIAGDFGAIAPMPAKTPAQIEAEESAKAKRELAALDLASIPLLRAYIAAKADAPQELKGLEAAAALKKAKVK